VAARWELGRLGQEAEIKAWATRRRGGGPAAGHPDRKTLERVLEGLRGGGCCSAR